MTTWGASLGAYHAVNTLLRYPHLVKRCYGFSGVYDLRRFMDGLYDDNFYFHNPVDYMANMTDGVVPGSAGELRDQAGDRIRTVGGQPSTRTRSRASWPAKASGIMSTTGDQRAAMTGLTGRK